MSPDELRRRILHAVLTPAARFARVFGLPLGETGKRFQVAYFHVLRGQGLRLREVCDALGISPSLAANLSKRLKESFADRETPALGRRIEFMLWTEALSEARLCQIMTDADPAQVQAALDVLQAEDRVERVAGRTVTYAIKRRSSRIVRDRLLSRLDGLNHLLEAVGNAVYGRFVDETDDAFARVLTLRVRAADMDRLHALYEEQIWPMMTALDAAAEGDPTAREVEVVLTWAPYRLMQRLEPETRETTD